MNVILEFSVLEKCVFPLQLASTMFSSFYHNSFKVSLSLILDFL